MSQSSDTLVSPELRLESSADRLWMVVRTRPRAEKQFARWCERMELPVFLPLYRRHHSYARATSAYDLPLFPGYVFAQLSDADRLAGERTRWVATVIQPDAPMEAQLITELRDIQRLLDASPDKVLEVETTLVVGQRVAISRGPLQGVSGVVTRVDQRLRVTVNVEMVGQAVSLELDLDDVESP